jgi:hypothetical protein
VKYSNGNPISNNYFEENLEEPYFRRDKVPCENIIVGTSFLTAISRGTKLYWELVAGKKSSQ